MNKQKSLTRRRVLTSALGAAAMPFIAGTARAQEHLRKWAKEYGPPSKEKPEEPKKG